MLLAQKDWYVPFPAFRIADHLYYVGSKDLASYLITTSQGDIVINSGFDRNVPQIRDGIEKLGFKPTDVKILLASHAHGDHVAGMAMLQEITGAKIYTMQGDVPVMESGGRGQYKYTDTWKPVKVDRVLHDGDKVTLGGVTLTAHLTPGHTRGCTTWTMRTTDGGKSYNVVIIGSPNVNAGFQLVNNRDYPQIATDFAHTFQVLKSLPCDIFLGAHGGYYNMVEKYEQMKAKGGNPFIDPAGYRKYVNQTEHAYLTKLEDQKKQAASGAPQQNPR